MDEVNICGVWSAELVSAIFKLILGSVISDHPPYRDKIETKSQTLAINTAHSAGTFLSFVVKPSCHDI